jgi:signal transduction histidine kinase
VAVVEPLVEAPLSVRSPLGVWAVLLTLTWFALAYRARNATWWEIALVAFGSAAALVRVGNVWLDALALLGPLARQLSGLSVPRLGGVAVGVASLGVAVVLALANRPPELPLTASQVALSAHARGRIFTDTRWAAELQHRAGATRDVLAADGLASASSEFWLDYLRVSQGHERWDTILAGYDVGVVVLEVRDRQRLAAELVRAAPDWGVLVDDGRVLVAERTER